MRTITVFALLALVGCKDKGSEKPAEPVRAEPAAAEPAKPPPPSTKPATPEPATTATESAKPTSQVLDLAAAKMIAEPGGEFSIDAAGNVVLNGKGVATLTKAGELTSNGVAVANIAADGTMEIMGWGPGLQLSVRADGAVLDHGKVVLEPTSDGTLVGSMTNEDNLKGGKLKVEGDKAGHRALIFAWLAVTKSDRVTKR